MTQHSEDRIENAPGPLSPSARILPFERPQSELQRAVQQRAQEAIDLDRERGRMTPAPLRWLTIALVAAIPVVLLFGAIDRLLHVFYKVNESFQSAPPATQPMEPQSAPTASEPGVVILQPVPTDPAEETPR